GRGEALLRGIGGDVPDVAPEEGLAAGEDEEDVGVDCRDLVDDASTLVRRQLTPRIGARERRHVAVRALEIAPLRQIPRHAVRGVGRSRRGGCGGRHGERPETRREPMGCVGWRSAWRSATCSPLTGSRLALRWTHAPVDTAQRIRGRRERLDTRREPMTCVGWRSGWRSATCSPLTGSRLALRWTHAPVDTAQLIRGRRERLDTRRELLACVAWRSGWRSATCSPLTGSRLALRWTHAPVDTAQRIR